MKKIALFLSLILVLILSSCGTENTDKGLTVAVSIEPQKTFAEMVCGDKATVISTIPAGASAENYEMSPKEIANLNNSDIYFKIGVPAEENSILPNLSEKTYIFDLTVPVSQAYPDLEIGTERDPHIWLSPKRAIVIVKQIGEQMSALDPENGNYYISNAQKYVEELEKLDLELSDKFKNRRKKTFYISHPSYGYFASDYGLEMVALENEGKEVTPKELSEITAKAKADNTKVIFVQEETSKKQAELLAKEIGGRIEILNPLSHDYINSIRETADLISEAVK